MERDENYVPHTRKAYHLPDGKSATKMDYMEAFEETPITTVYRLFIQQFLYVIQHRRMTPGASNKGIPAVGGFT